MNLYDAIRTQALHAVLRPDGDYLLRHIFRWYSMTFNTPLMDVYDLPIDFVLQHYYEMSFENLPEEERLAIIDEVIETDEERAQRRQAEDAKPLEEAEFVKFAQQLKQVAKPKFVVTGDDDAPPVVVPPVAEPAPLPVTVTKNEHGLPEFSMAFEDEGNLIEEDLEHLNSMRQPEE